METAENITLPERWADKVRAMEVGAKMDITEKGRAAAYNQANLAFPGASFRTQGHEGRIYLIRTA